MCFDFLCNFVCKLSHSNKNSARYYHIYIYIYIYSSSQTNTQIAKELKITLILDKLLGYKRSWIQHVNRMSRNRLPRVMKYYSPTVRRNHGRPLKRLMDTWDRNGSTSGPTAWQIYIGLLAALWQFLCQWDCKEQIQKLVELLLCTTENCWKHWAWLCFVLSNPRVTSASLSWLWLHSRSSVTVELGWRCAVRHPVLCLGNICPPNAFFSGQYC